MGGFGVQKERILKRERLYLLSRNHFFHLPLGNKLVKSLEEGRFRFRSRFSLLPLYGSSARCFLLSPFLGGCLFQI
jgi:hypothetical protein